MFAPMIVATVCLVAGISLYFYGSRGTSPNPHSVLLIAWLLVALTPVFLVFTFFPSSTVSGRIQGFTFGGAFAAFVFIWWYGSSRSIKLRAVDRVELELRDEKLRCSALESEMSRAAAERTPLALAQQDVFSYRVASRKSRKIAIITGDILNVRCADIWVNSENTNMQMSRFHEGSVSAAIRYHGAEKTPTGSVMTDTIARELAEQVGPTPAVEPASVFSTSAGELTQTNNVKRILHVAAVFGEPRLGYRGVSDIGRCVTQVLNAAEREAAGMEAHSVLLPLLSTGSGRANLEATTRAILVAAIEWLGSERSKEIVTVLILAYKDSELQTSQKLLAESGLVSVSKS